MTPDDDDLSSLAGHWAGRQIIMKKKKKKKSPNLRQIYLPLSAFYLKSYLKEPTHEFEAHDVEAVFFFSFSLCCEYADSAFKNVNFFLKP